MKQQIFLVTGTPGTGKSSFSRLLAKQLNCTHIDISALKGQKSVVLGYDDQRLVPIVSPAKIRKFIVDKYKSDKGLVIDSHFAHDIYKKATLCIVLRCSPKVLISRLKKRHYSKAKIQENLEAELMGICEDEAFKLGHKLLVLDSSKKSAKTLVRTALSTIKSIRT